MKGSKKGITFTREQALKLAKSHPEILVALNTPKLGVSCPSLPSEPRKGQSTPFEAKEPKMTRAEMEYERILKREYPDCEILYEKYTLKLAHDLRYTPDFAVVFPNGVIDFYEIKGKFIFSKAMNKPKFAAEVFHHRFWLAHKTDSGWNLTALKGKADRA